MEQEEGLCVGCGEFTANAIECNCTRAIFACEGCCKIGTTLRLRCAACRERERRTVYPCLDYRDDPELGRDMGGGLPVAAPVGAWGPPYRAA